MTPINDGEKPNLSTKPKLTPIPKKVKANTRLVRGPTIATKATPHSPNRTLCGLNGTGLAPPNTGAPNINNTNGNKIVRNGSMCLIGLSDSLPSALAV